VWRERGKLLLVFLAGSTVPAWYPIVRDAFTHPPQAIVGAIGSSALEGRHVFLNRDDEGTVRGTIDLMLSIEATNNLTTPFEIVGYTAQAKYEGRWYPLKRVSLLTPYVEWKGPSRVLYFDLSDTSFDILARSGVLEPGHTVRGWGLFAWPDMPDTWEQSDSSGKFIHPGIQAYRITVIDNKGTSSTIETPVKVFPHGDESMLTGGQLKTMPLDWVPPWERKH